MPIGYTNSGVSLDLIRSVRAGDLAAFGDLVRNCRRCVMGTVGRLIARPEDVEDVAQEVFFRMYTSIRQLKQPEAFDLWAYRLTTHATYDYLRKRPMRREVRMSDLLDGEIAAATDSASCQSLWEERERRRIIEYVDDLLGQLSPADRIVIIMREVEELSMREIAEVLGIRVGAAKVRLFRARCRLRELINPEVTAAADPEDCFLGGANLKDQVAGIRSLTADNVF